jgi:hypothetical protein
MNGTPSAEAGGALGWGGGASAGFGCGGAGAGEGSGSGCASGGGGTGEASGAGAATSPPSHDTISVSGATMWDTATGGVPARVPWLLAARAPAARWARRGRTVLCASDLSTLSGEPSDAGGRLAKRRLVVILETLLEKDPQPIAILGLQHEFAPCVVLDVRRQG